jgi:hypothetical protein
MAIGLSYASRESFNIKHTISNTSRRVFLIIILFEKLVIYSRILSIKINRISKDAASRCRQYLTNCQSKKNHFEIFSI